MAILTTDHSDMDLARDTGKTYLGRGMQCLYLFAAVLGDARCGTTFINISFKYMSFRLCDIY